MPRRSIKGVPLMFIYRQLPASLFRLLTLCQLQILLQVLLKNVVGQPHLLIDVPHAHIYKGKGNDCEEHEQPVGNKEEENACDSEELTEGDWHVGEEDQDAVEDKNAGELEEHGPDGVGRS